MKTCAYCGGENADEVEHCLTCGTELAVDPVDAKPKEPRDRTWIKVAFGWAAAAMTIILCYFLSLGPVIRSFGTVISSSSTVVSSNATTIAFTTTRAVSYPRWVAILYAPAFRLGLEPGAGNLGSLYYQYLEWWEKPKTNS